MLWRLTLEMKRLLLAPLLIAGLQSPANALPWSGDIELKNSVGEKYIVKKSTIETESYDHKEWLKRSSRIINMYEYDSRSNQNRVDELNQKAADCRETKEYKEYGSRAKPSLCETLFSTGSPVYKNYLASAEEAKQNVLKEKTEYKKVSDFFEMNNSPKVHWVQIKYVPIFQDINKRKTVQKGKSINCPNPELSSQARGIYSSMRFASSELELMVCDKYAKF